MLSIVTPVLNGAKFIQENIESILKLTISHEHIIVDGGSTDGTLEILKKYPHIKVLHQSDKKGMYKAIDMGFEIATGDYLCWINCDDRVIPETYDKFYSYASENKYDFVSSSGIHHYINENREIIIRTTRLQKYFLKKRIFPFSQPSTLFSKYAYYKVGKLRYEKFKIIGDFDLYYRMAIDDKLEFSYIQIVTSIFFKYGNSLYDRSIDLARKEEEQLPVRLRLITRILFKLSRLLKI